MVRRDANVARRSRWSPPHTRSAGDQRSDPKPTDRIRGGIAPSERSPGKSGQAIFVGDVVQTRRNDSVADVQNRQNWIVKTIGKDHVILAASTDSTDLRKVTLDYAASHLHLAYATTVYGVQGETTDRSLVGPGVDAAGLYVGLTRGKAAQRRRPCGSDRELREVPARRDDATPDRGRDDREVASSSADRTPTSCAIGRRTDRHGARSSTHARLASNDQAGRSTWRDQSRTALGRADCLHPEFHLEDRTRRWRLRVRRPYRQPAGAHHGARRSDARRPSAAETDAALLDLSNVEIAALIVDPRQVTRTVEVARLDRSSGSHDGVRSAEVDHPLAAQFDCFIVRSAPRLRLWRLPFHKTSLPETAVLATCDPSPEDGMSALARSLTPPTSSRRKASIGDWS